VTTKRRVPRDEALAVAHEAIALLAPACHRLEIAGSIRRGRPEVGDVELVAVPRVHAERADLFGERTVEVDELHDLAAQLLEGGAFAHRPDGRSRVAFGGRFKRLVFRGVALDLFSVREPAQWGVIFLLRTGPAGFSKRLVTPRQYGGCLPLGYRVHEGALWNGGERVPTPEEADYLAALRAPWIAPEQRTDTVRLSLDTEVERTKRTGAPPRWGWYDGDAKTGWWPVEGREVGR
jgi:DNA polymerase/3'-5' exonuclease PolX